MVEFSDDQGGSLVLTRVFDESGVLPLVLVLAWDGERYVEKTASMDDSEVGLYLENVPVRVVELASVIDRDEFLEAAPNRRPGAGHGWVHLVWGTRGPQHA